MRSRFAIAALAAACLSSAVLAQMGPPTDARGMGPGMMGGPGMGPAMAGGREGCGMGPGMMGGAGMGHGMMGGQGMSHGKWAGWTPGALEALSLNDEQRARITEIRRDVQRKFHALMGAMREARWQAQDAAKSAQLDEGAARKSYDAIAAVSKQMFEAGLEGRKKIETVLSKEQLEQLRRPGPRRAGPPPPPRQ